MKQPIFSLLLALCLLTSLLVAPATVSAANSGIYTYTVSNGEATITDCDSSAAGAILIPSVLGGYPVTTIGNYAFAFCDGLTRVTIGDSVTSIGNSAFSYCESLTSVTIPDSVTSIGNGAFNSCDSLTSVTIPDSVTSIGDEAFYCCISLTSVTIGDSVTSIGDEAFYGCISLTSVTIPDSVTSIGDRAFHSCDSLTSVTIGDSVTSIGVYAFAFCDRLTSVTIGDGVTSIGGFEFYGCISLTSVTIPDSVTSIGLSAFHRCDSLTSITIPDSVTSIGYGAFRYCNSLTDVYYAGTQEQWNAISIGDDNACLTNATIHSKESFVTVAYNANGGYGEPEAHSESGKAILSHTVPKKLGNTFLGWATSADAVAPQYQPGETVIATADIDLYAVWEKTSYVTLQKIPVSGMTMFQITATGIPAGSEIIFACYQGERLSYAEPLTKLEGQGVYYVIPLSEYTFAKVMVLEDFDTCAPVTEVTDAD